MGHRQPKHQCDADGQRDGDLKRGDAVGDGQIVTALNEIVSGVVDAGTGHEGEDTGQQEDGDRRLRATAKMRASRVSGMTASREAAKASSPNRMAVS